MAEQTRIIEENGELIYEVHKRGPGEPGRVNLTRLYGKGKEPTLDQLDEWNQKAKDIGAGSYSKTYPDMRKVHGTKSGEICGDCKWFEVWDYRDRRYFKCIKRGTSHSNASDIRKGDTACGLFDPKKKY